MSHYNWNNETARYDTHNSTVNKHVTNQVDLLKIRTFLLIGFR